MKRNWILVMFILFAVAAASAQTAADFTFDANGVITAYSGFDTDITIPAAIGGKAVTAIGDKAFQKAELTSVVIPQSVTRIGVNAFEGNKLTAVTIPNSVTFIGEEAFGNNQLTSIIIPDSVTEIGNVAFRNNPTLAAVTLGGGVRTVGFGAFDLRGRPSFTIAANIIPEPNFYPGSNENKHLPNGIFFNYIANGRKAGTYTFDMPAVEKTADDHVYIETQFGAVLITYRGNSTRLRVPAEIGGIAVTALSGTSGGLAVYYRTSITAVQIPESVTYIGANSFRGCQLTSLTIPNGVTYIGSSAFQNNRLDSLTISNSVTYIGVEAFRENPLTSLTIGNSVTSIERGVFLGHRLTSFTIPNSVTSIGASAFSGSLTSVTIPNSVTSIGAGAFGDRVTSVTIGANVSFEGGDTYGLERFYINGGRRAGTYTRLDGYSTQWTRR